MILYDPTDRMGFLEFGIQIPILDSKVTRTFEALAQDPELGPLSGKWHLARIEETLDRDDLQAGTQPWLCRTTFFRRP